MKKLRVYVDTSVIGGCFDPEFELWSNQLMRDFRTGTVLPILSEIVRAEINSAPQRVQDLYAELISLGNRILVVDEESLAILDNYKQRLILPARCLNDMLHIALATVAQVDVLVSWNFKHIVRLDKIHAFNGVNLELGYQPIQIYSPREILNYGKDTD